MRRVLIACDGASVPAELEDQNWTDRREIRSFGPNADFQLSLSGLGGAILKTLSARSIDLLRIAAYVFRVDQIISRGGERDAHASRWKRNLSLCVPVSDPVFWSGSTVAERLTSALRFLTDDLWDFAFAYAPPELMQLPLEVPTEEVMGQPTAIIPFSGGIDSLSILLEIAANGGRPIAVSHWSTEAHKARQLAILDEIRQRFRGWAFPLVGLPLHGKGSDPADSSQRSRGFLYAALASAIAGELGMARVLFGDNGPVSINLPINDQLVGALASRATHPQFHHRFNEFAMNLYPNPVEVTNPLRDRTRTEALEVFKLTHCEDLLPLTLSCSKWRGLPAATPHCGGCYQCIDRRFATVAAKLEDHDPASRYRRDVFIDEPINWEADETAQSYVRFSRHVLQMGDVELVEAFPQLYDLPTPGDPDPEATIFAGVDLAKRHAMTIIGVVKVIADRHLDALVEGTLPTSCLLRKIFAGTEHHAGSWVNSEVRHDEAAVQPPAVAGKGEDTEIARSERKNVFAFEGDLWTLAYLGIIGHMRPSVGLTRLAVLLSEPGRQFTAEELLLVTEGRGTEVTSDSQADHQGLRPEGYASGGTKLDRRAIGEYEQEVRELLREIEGARGANNAVRVAALQQQIDQIGREAQTGVGLGGRLRPFVDALSRNQTTVYQSIRRVLPKLTKVHSELGAHLERSVRLSTTMTYAPEHPISWHVVLPHEQA